MRDLVTLRPATRADAPAIVSVINDAFRVERFFVNGDRTSPDEIDGLMGKGTFLLAEESGTIIGCVYVDVTRAPAYLGLLAIAPTDQRRGVGRLLMDAAEQWCDARGARTIQIRVVNLRDELPPFYRRRGYRECGTEPFSAPSTRPCHFIVMEKTLAPGRAPQPRATAPRDRA
jgi:GNAT superfamily N-acetyltransferase